MSCEISSDFSVKLSKLHPECLTLPTIYQRDLGKCPSKAAENRLERACLGFLHLKEKIGIKISDVEFKNEKRYDYPFVKNIVTSQRIALLIGTTSDTKQSYKQKHLILQVKSPSNEVLSLAQQKLQLHELERNFRVKKN